MYEFQWIFWSFLCKFFLPLIIKFFESMKRKLHLLYMIVCFSRSLALSFFNILPIVSLCQRVCIIGCKFGYKAGYELCWNLNVHVCVLWVTNEIFQFFYRYFHKYWFFFYNGSYKWFENKVKWEDFKCYWKHNNKRHFECKKKSSGTVFKYCLTYVRV